MKISATSERINALIHQKKTPDDKLFQRCLEFEAVFVKKMLEVSQPKNSLFGSGMQGDFYRDFYLDEMAKEITKNPGIGLAESMYRVLKRSEETAAQQKDAERE
jgi:flagellar protein FlgJ